jgi:polyhydroxyalkanoate synthesis regulator phasin
MNEMMHKILMAGLGVPEKINEVIDELVKKGELSESQGAKLVKECSEKVSSTGEEINRTVSDLTEKALEKMNIPTRDEIDKLNKKITTLAAKIKKIEQSTD